MFNNKIILFSFVIANSCCARPPLQSTFNGMTAQSQQDPRDQLMRDSRIIKDQLSSELRDIRDTPTMSSEAKSAALIGIIYRATAARTRINPISVTAAREFSFLINRARSLQANLLQATPLQANYAR